LLSLCWELQQVSTIYTVATFLLKNRLYSILYVGEMQFIDLMAADRAESMND